MNAHESPVDSQGRCRIPDNTCRISRPWTADLGALNAADPIDAVVLRHVTWDHADPTTAGGTR